MLNTLNVDLHNHTAASDGILSADALIALAHENRCDAFAVTDHDTMANVEAARIASEACGMPFVSGVEISVSWRAADDIDSPSKTIHIVGLNVDASNSALDAGLQAVRGGRLRRGRLIADTLMAAGIDDIFDDALALAENKEMLGRTHFARALIARGVVKDTATAFKRFLTPGNPGYVPHQWASLADAVSWIRGAGGVAVIAHPGRYNLDARGKNGINALFGEFKDLGGQAIEVVTGSHSPNEYAPFAKRCKEFGFFASRGADFHSAHETPAIPGSLPTLEKVDTNLQPVWALFPDKIARKITNKIAV
jgi:3',5'-nucleoside bisphosphate phosphatase